jgi:hypothetical protein
MRFSFSLCAMSTRTVLKPLLSNYALERSAKWLWRRAAGARNIIAPAARGPGCARTAQRGR